MSTFWRLINFTKHEYLDGNDFGQGRKYFSLLENHLGVMGGGLILLTSSWKGDQVALGADYGVDFREKTNLLPHLDLTSPEPSNVDEIKFNGRRYRSAANKAITLAFASGVNLVDWPAFEVQGMPNENAYSESVSGHVIFNFTKNQYLDPLQFGDPSNVYEFVYKGGFNGILTAFAWVMQIGNVAIVPEQKERKRNKITVDDGWAGDSIGVIERNSLPKNGYDISPIVRYYLSYETDDAEREIYKMDPSGFILRDRLLDSAIELNDYWEKFA